MPSFASEQACHFVEIHANSVHDLRQTGREHTLVAPACMEGARSTCLSCEMRDAMMEPSFSSLYSVESSLSVSCVE